MKYEWKDYMVHELAKFYGISGSTVRHYDRKNILQASKKEESDYRVYSRDDFILMDYIMRLRKLEIPLDDIHKAVNEYKLEDVEALILKKKEELEAEIQHLQSVHTMTANYYRTMEQAKEAEGKFLVRDMPAIICKDITTSFFATMEYFERLNIGLLPILTFVTESDDWMDEAISERLMDPEERAELTNLVITSIDWENVNERDDFPEEDFRIVPSGRYIHYFERVTTHSDYTALPRMAAYARENGLKIRGKAFTRMLGANNGRKIDYYEHYLPIE